MSYPGSTTTIELYSPLQLADGSLLEEVTMREPLVRDRIAFSKARGTDEEKEAKMLADLCNINESDMTMITTADYLQLTEAFQVFMLPPKKRPKTKSSKV